MDNYAVKLKNMKELLWKHINEKYPETKGTTANIDFKKGEILFTDDAEENYKITKCNFEKNKDRFIKVF